MEIWQLALLFVAGVASGWINVLAGGGSLLSVALLVLFGVSGPAANGTNRISILAQNVMAVATFKKRGFSDFRLSLSLAAAASLGAVVGASFGARLDGVWFDRTLAAVMIAILAIMAAGRSEKSIATADHDGKPKRLLLGHFLMVGAGVWGGFIQIGVGFMMMPILARVMGFDLVRVNMHKVFIALIYTIVAFLVFAAKVEIAWIAGFALAAGNILGGWWGAHSAVTKGEALIRRVFMAAILAMVVKLLFF